MSAPHRSRDETLRQVIDQTGTRLRVFGSEDQAVIFAQQLCDSETLPPDEPGFVAANLVRGHALIVSTGSIGLSSRELASRQSSLCCYHLVVVLGRQQCWPDMTRYLDSLDGDRLIDLVGSALVWVTGPSRTADIEKVLVTPAHGPARVTLCLYDRPGSASAELH